MLRGHNKRLRGQTTTGEKEIVATESRPSVAISQAKNLGYDLSLYHLVSGLSSDGSGFWLLEKKLHSKIISQTSTTDILYVGLSTYMHHVKARHESLGKGILVDHRTQIRKYVLVLIPSYLVAAILACPLVHNQTWQMVIACLVAHAKMMIL